MANWQHVSTLISGLIEELKTREIVVDKRPYFLFVYRGMEIRVRITSKIANHSSQWSNMADRKTSPKASSSRAGGNRRGPPPEPSSASFLEFIQQVQPRISLRRVTVSEEEMQRARMIVILTNLAAALEDDDEA